MNNNFKKISDQIAINNFGNFITIHETDKITGKTTKIDIHIDDFNKIIQEIK